MHIDIQREQLGKVYDDRFRRYRAARIDFSRRETSVRRYPILVRTQEKVHKVVT